MIPIVQYLKEGKLPDDKQEAVKVVRKASAYAVKDDILYRTSFSDPWARCVSKDEGDYVLREIHEGICGAHEGALAISRRAALLGYYWPTMNTDAKEFQM